jgi:hypothetical protein
VLQADTPGQVLLAASGVDTLSDAGDFGKTFQGTLAGFTNALISGLSTKDLIAITDLTARPSRPAMPGRAARVCCT